MEINNIGAQQPTLPTNVQDQAVSAGTSNIAEQSQQIDSAAENAFASVFFSLLQNILSEAQNNSGS